MSSEIEVLRTEIDNYRNYIVDLKSRIAVYVPVKTDLIDKRIAEYINNYPDRSKLKIMFSREAEGVYQFGSKRIAVRVEKEKINIRVGGGYMTIDEFLDQYTPIEVEKLERKDPMKRVGEKVSVTRTIQSQMTDSPSGAEQWRSQMGSCASPVRASPTKTTSNRVVMFNNNSQ